LINISLLGHDIKLCNPNIESVYLFGSTARGDNDNYSDLDILIIINDCDEDTFIRTKLELAKCMNIPSDWISLYKIGTIKMMHEYGSYFLWHIKMEGIKLYSKNNAFENLLSTLTEYKKTKVDLIEYRNICDDILVSIESDDVTLSYELSILASIVRNTCIALAYINHKKEFGRISVVTVCQKIMGMNCPFSLSEYEDLYKYRIAYIRNIEMKLTPTFQLVKMWIRYAVLLIDYSLAYLKGE
jgi:predicted nucleotidyltransferase